MTAPTPRLVNGRYEFDGLVLPRVSSVLAVVAKPGLEKWRHRVGLKEAERISKTATALGKRVHAACEAMELGKTPPADADLQPFIVAFGGWLDGYVSEVVAVEQFVWHRRHLYGGTADLIAVMRDGRRMLVDLKTSNSIDGIYRLQTTAYAAALAEMGTPVDGRMVVQMPSQRPGELNMVLFDDDVRDRKAWESALRLYRWNERHKFDWKQRPGRQPPTNVPSIIEAEWRRLMGEDV